MALNISLAILAAICWLSGDWLEKRKPSPAAEPVAALPPAPEPAKPRAPRRRKAASAA